MGRRDEGGGLSPRARARLRGAVPGTDDGPRADVPPSAAVRGGYVARPEDLVAPVRTPSAAGEGAGPGGGAVACRAAGSPGRHRRVRPPAQGWVRLPASFVGARWQPGRAGVLGVVAVAVLAVLVLGVRVAWARSAAEPAVVAPGGGARAGPTGISAGAAPVGLGGTAGSSVAPVGGATGAVDPGAVGARGYAGATAGPTVGAVVVVHVVGEVRDPGVQRLPAGSRVSDAVAAAGGATRTGRPRGRSTSPGSSSTASRCGCRRRARPCRRPPAGRRPARRRWRGCRYRRRGRGTVSLNAADPATLETLPGVGPVLAQRIVEWRTAHGGFTSVDELTEVSGIGEKTFEQLRPLVTP